MSANPLAAMSFTETPENVETQAPTNVVEIRTRSGVIQLHRETLEIAWPARTFCRIVDVEEFVTALRAALMTAEEIVFERARVARIHGIK